MGFGPELTRDEVALLLAAKDAEIAVLTALVAELTGRVEVLEAVGRGNSSMSGRAPSSDDPHDKAPAEKRSSRTRSGRGRGRQDGAPGATLRLVEVPDETIACPATCCGGCGLGLGDVEVFAEQRR